MNSFFRELKQRKVYRVALGYAVVAWLVIQISATVMPAYHAPEWILPIFITVIALGFPVALVIAWTFELTPEGLKRTEYLAESTGPENRAWLRGMKLAKYWRVAGWPECCRPTGATYFECVVR
jgi:hypothetical protein